MVEVVIWVVVGSGGDVKRGVMGMGFLSGVVKMI